MRETRSGEKAQVDEPDEEECKVHQRDDSKISILDANEIQEVGEYKEASEQRGPEQDGSQSDIRRRVRQSVDIHKTDRRQIRRG